MPGQNARYLRRVAVSWQGLCGWLIALFAFAALSAPAAAQPVPHIAPALVAERAATPGGSVRVALAMTPSPGWHGYWVNPGDAGLGVTLRPLDRTGATWGPLAYPVPGTLVVGGLMNHVYEAPYALIATVKVPADARPGTALPLSVAANWLACTEQICVLEQAQLSLALPVAAPGAPAPADPRFAGWLQHLPAPLGSPARFAIEGQRLRVAIPLPAAQPLANPHLFLVQDRVASYSGAQEFARDGDWLVASLPRANLAPITPATLDAVLRFDNGSGSDGAGVSFTARPGPVPAGGTPLATGKAASALGLAALVGAAFLGGLLLNVMPCVFPILSLKALSLARAGGDARHARAEGLAYAAGVVLACCALGAALLGLRAAGQQVGWAFQLQEPLAVAGLLALSGLITANLVGLFELSVPGFAASGGRARDGVGGAFATGLLAAFAATPCTGPFMAGAMGAALVLPPLPALLLFASLGLGIAAPFLALAFVPALRRAMPRPGRWMDAFRKAMALPMALTAAALVWLASRLAGWPFAALAAAATLVLVAFAAAIGSAQRRGLPAPRAAWAAIAGVTLAAALALPRLESAGAGAEAGVLNAHPWSEAELARARAAGHPVFAWFTADWCLSCKVNERLAIEREDTRTAFARAGVVALRGDWTRRDPAISAYLERMGAAGVPLYVWYPAGGGAPRVLPQVLTPATLPDLAAGKP